MNEQLSPKMKQMTRIYGWVIPVVLIFCVAAACLIGGMALKNVSVQTSVPDVKEFDVYGGADIPGSLEASLMTYEFASDFKETNHFYFVFDRDFAAYIVEIHGALTEEQSKLQNILYSEEEITEEPQPVLFTGVSAPIEDDIRQFAMETYNQMFGEEIVDETNFSDYFGDYYLDTTRKPASPVPDSVNLLFLTAVLLVIIGVWLMIYRTGKTKATRNTLAAWPPEKLLLVDGQLNQPVTAAYEKEKLYLTSDYIVSNAKGLSILPYTSAARVFDTAAGGGKRKIVAESTDHTVHTLAVISAKGEEGKARLTELLEAVKRKIAEKKEVLIMEGMPENSGSDGTLRQTEAVSAHSKLLPGLIGAVFGSLIGVALWVLIGQVGFIAGIAGFVILKFALTGYGKLGGGLDKKGAVVCLIVAAFMILGANVLDSIVSLTRAYLEYDSSLETVAFVVGNFSGLMTEMDMWGGFMIDLAIGFALSIWSSFGAIKAILNGHMDGLV